MKGNRIITAEAEIRVITVFAEHIVRTQEITGADALLMAIELVRCMGQVAA